MTRPAFLVTIDTEEEGLWANKYRTSGYTVENIRNVPRFQALCDRYGIRPTYLIDTLVAENPESNRILRQISDSQRCEIGAHLHPWCAPPYVEQLDDYHSYMCNLPIELQREKLINLTNTIEEKFGQRPTSFRAGRYGLDGDGVRLLIELGYIVDSSVLPFWDYSPSGGPDFSLAPVQPYRVGRFDLLTRDDESTFWEVPVTAGYNHSDFLSAAKTSQWLSTGWRKRLRMHSVLGRLGLYERWKLSPEQINGRKMIRLVQRFIQSEAPCVVLMFHSSSLAVGKSPYVPSEAKLEAFYRDLDEVFEYCTQQAQMAGLTLTDFAHVLRGEVAPPNETIAERT